MVEASTDLTQDGVNMNKKNEEQSPIIKNTNIDGKADADADAEEDCNFFALNTHDASFEMDKIDRKLLELNLNLSRNSNSSAPQMKSQEHDITDSSLDEFPGFNSSDIVSTSDTEATESSILISDDDDDSMSHTTATGEVLDTDENVSNLSSAILPSVAESDDKMIPFSDGDRDGMSEEFSNQMNGNVVLPCQDNLTDDLSADKIDKKLLLIQQFPNQIRKKSIFLSLWSKGGKVPNLF